MAEKTTIDDDNAADPLDLLRTAIASMQAAVLAAESAKVPLAAAYADLALFYCREQFDRLDGMSARIPGVIEVVVDGASISR